MLPAKYSFMGKIIVFDFDGVLVDTADETVDVALNAYEKMAGQKLNGREGVRRRLRAARPLFKNAEDIYAGLRLILSEQSLDVSRLTQEAFDKEARACLQEAKTFAAKFYSTRDAMIAKDTDKWAAMNPLYPGIRDVFLAAQKSHTVVIATTKNKTAVKILLSKNNINLPESHIVSREFSTDKLDQMRFIMRQYAARPEDILYIEDLYEWLKYVGKLGVGLALVSWGYGRAKDFEEARRAGVPVVKTAAELGELISTF